MENSTYPMQMNRFVGVLHETRTKEFNYGNVRLDKLCPAVVASLVEFFERPEPRTYAMLKKDYERIRENLARKGEKMTLEGFASMLRGDGIEGFPNVIALALEWKLTPYIEEWDSHLNEWLDHPSGPGTLD